MGIVIPGESSQYRTARDRLLEQELELRALTERVAAARRALPEGGIPPHDYIFREGGPDGERHDVRLSQLFSPGRSSLVLYSFMFAQSPCPACTALLDQLDGAAQHVRQRLDFAVVAKATLPLLLDFAEQRGWRHLRLLSSAENSYNRDYHAETEDGAQQPMLTVFRRDGERVRHFWSSELFFAPTEGGQEPRHVGTLEPLWNMFDLTPDGRPQDWEEQLLYA